MAWERWASQAASVGKSDSSTGRNSSRGNAEAVMVGVERSTFGGTDGKCPDRYEWFVVGLKKWASEHARQL
jgi:hypothetical protein